MRIEFEGTTKEYFSLSDPPTLTREQTSAWLATVSIPRPTSGFEALALGDRLKYLRWLLSHTNELGAFGALYDQFEAATTVSEKLGVVLEAGKLLQTILDDFPSSGQSIGALSVESVQALAMARGIRWDRLGKIGAWLLENLPAIIALIPK